MTTPTDLIKICAKYFDNQSTYALVVYYINRHPQVVMCYNRNEIEETIKTLSTNIQSKLLLIKIFKVNLNPNTFKFNDISKQDINLYDGQLYKKKTIGFVYNDGEYIGLWEPIYSLFQDKLMMWDYVPAGSDDPGPSDPSVGVEDDSDEVSIVDLLADLD